MSTMKTFLVKWINPGSAKFNNGKDETGECKISARNNNDAKKKFNSGKGSYHKTFSDTKILSVTNIS